MEKPSVKFPGKTGLDKKYEAALPKPIKKLREVIQDLSEGPPKPTPSKKKP